MHGGERLFGQEFVENSLGVAVDHDRVRQIVFRNAGGREAGVFGGDLDAEEIVFGSGRGGGLQEKTFAAADFDFQRARGERAGPRPMVAVDRRTS